MLSSRGLASFLTLAVLLFAAESARIRHQNQTARAGGCCKWGRDCGGCGNDGTDWCHQSSSNCAACSGIFDGSASKPVCRTPSGVNVFTATWAGGQDEGYPTFRIPAIIALDNGDMLVFAEGRFGGDHGHNDIVMRRSSDAGKTWSPLLKVYGESTSTHSVTMGNPAPIALHTHPGHIVLVACRENADVLTMKSTDYGRTWSKPSYITGQVKESSWSWVATGPPQGLQLESGRLIICADHYAPNWGSHSMYSDDFGQTWHISKSIDGVGGNECQVARAPDGSLIMNMRTLAGKRQFAWSHDDGTTWSAPITSPFHDLTYGGGACEGSTVALPSCESDGMDGMLVFSTPFNNVEGFAGRFNMSLFVSDDSGLHWQPNQQVYPGKSAYSAMLPINCTHVGLVFEKDDYKTLNYLVLQVRGIPNSPNL